MSQPSQQFPPWLSPSPVVITDAAGNPVATDTVIEYIPPTYFGPSIPLGSLYIFGGSTEPATIVLPSATPQTTTSAPQSITTATPTTTTILTTSATSSTSVLSISSSASITSATPTSSITSSSASSVSVSTSSTSPTSSLSLTSSISSSSLSLSPSGSITSSASPSSSTAPSPIQASGLSRGQLVGVIVASILGLVFLFVLALFLFLCLKGRRNRRNFTTLTPIDEDYYIVPPGGRAPGEGSPRHSGEEADPFLQRSSPTQWPGVAAGAAVGAATMTQVPSQAASRNGGTSRVPPPVATTGSNSSGSTNSNASGFGVLLDRPSLGYLPSMPEHQEVGGVALSPSDMARIGRESVLPDNADQYQYTDEEYAGAYAYSQDPQVPPRLINTSSPAGYSPLMGGERPLVTTQPSNLSNKSSLGPSDPEEAATLLTARRVKVEDLGPRSTAHIPDDAGAGPSTGFLGALGLGGLANIGRLSWFKNLDSPRHSITASTPEYSTVPLSEKDLETGRSMLSPDSRQVDSFGNRPRGGLGVGTGADGLRPISSTSARSGASGATTYHDAQSSLPATPLLAPLPRALTPAEQDSTEQAWTGSPLASPPAYTDRPLATSSTPPPTSSAPDLRDSPASDILDLPAPTALNYFSSISSLKDTPTGSSFGSKLPPFPPPGLETTTIRPVGWSDTATEVTASRGSFAGFSTGIHALDYAANHYNDHSHDINAISIDVLEEEPPNAEQGWRTISSTGSGGAGGGGFDPSRRGTFGLFMPGPGGLSSEQGSLHSMRSHFTPSNRSTGSAPAGSHMGSTSSRAHSLLRTGSISSDERKRLSPALSAFGHGTGYGHQMRASSSTGSGSGGHHSQHPSVEPPLSPVIGSPPSVHMGPDKSTTLRSMGSGADSSYTAYTSLATTRARERERSISPSNASMSMATDAPWAGGLASDWQASV
ncbi:hypothetical protein CVT25_000528 [Psilocybe cyanescens]|uniref:Uncharacterized protein n=1 Tax=Psilocybe cyanescens TaxID=93625 RepID=A0A409WZT1_PSICY|nr:hypothetical protein CVT25_000528 [Psilocybe cyanescens]